MAPSGEALGYVGLESLLNQAAHGFRDGIAGGWLNAGCGHVAAMLENGIPYLAMSHALKKIDLIEVSINRAFCGPALARMINLTSCETLLSHRYAVLTAENMIGRSESQQTTLPIRPIRCSLLSLHSTKSCQR